MSREDNIQEKISNNAFVGPRFHVKIVDLDTETACRYNGASFRGIASLKKGFHLRRCARFAILIVFPDAEKDEYFRIDDVQLNGKPLSMRDTFYHTSHYIQSDAHEKSLIFIPSADELHHATINMILSTWTFKDEAPSIPDSTTRFGRQREQTDSMLLNVAGSKGIFQCTSSRNGVWCKDPIRYAFSLNLVLDPELPSGTQPTIINTMREKKRKRLVEELAQVHKDMSDLMERTKRLAKEFEEFDTE